MTDLILGPYTNAVGTVPLPGSKSISNRVLLLAALAHGETVIDNILDAEDTQLMLNALRELGVHYTRNGQRCIVTGTQGVFPVKSAELFLGNAGTAVRSLTAALAMNHGEYRISGVRRMHERPIRDLVDSLRQIGAVIDYLEGDGFLPIAIRPAQLAIQAPIRVRGDISSQFLTALLIALPTLPAWQGGCLHRNATEIEIEIDGEVISQPYIEMTIQLMARFGVLVKREGWHRLLVPARARYCSPGYLAVEGDASSASYFLAAGALGGGPVRVTGIGQTSIQGDVGFTQVLMQMGANVISGDHWIEVSHTHIPHILKGALKATASLSGQLAAIDIDCSAIPDAAMTIAIVALFANGTSTLRNIGSWRVKETDRIAAMATELRKVGATIDTGADWLRITPPAKLIPNAEIDTYDDHRIAMCFSLISLIGVPVKILNPQCVHKTFPDYFKRFLTVVYPTNQGPHPIVTLEKNAEKLHIPIITIDGPSASGKGTIAQAVATKLGFYYLDSGMLYRLTAVASLRKGVAPDDIQALVQLASKLKTVFPPNCIQLDGVDVSQAIRTEQVSVIASVIAEHTAVRAALIAQQRAFQKPPGLVAEGRDMGTIIFPEADLKIFLTANVLTRAQRRYKQLLDKGFSVNILTLLQDLKERDARDSIRAAAPLKPAEDAKMLDTSSFCIDEVVNIVIKWFTTVYK